MPRNTELVCYKGGAIHPRKGCRYYLYVVLEHFTTLQKIPVDNKLQISSTTKLRMILVFDKVR